jgi:hypothetical protein
MLMSARDTKVVMWWNVMEDFSGGKSFGALGWRNFAQKGPLSSKSATLSAGFALPLKLDGHDVLFPALARFSYVVTEEALALACRPEGPPVTSEMCESHKGKYQGVGQGIAYRNGLDDRRLSRCGFYKLLSWAE